MLVKIGIQNVRGEDTKQRERDQENTKHLIKRWLHWKDHPCHLGGKAPPAAFGRIGLQCSIENLLTLPSPAAEVTSNSTQISTENFRKESSWIIHITHMPTKRHLILSKKGRWFKGVFFLPSLDDAWDPLLQPKLANPLISFYRYNLPMFIVKLHKFKILFRLYILACFVIILVSYICCYYMMNFPIFHLFICTKLILRHPMHIYSLLD